MPTFTTGSTVACTPDQAFAFVVDLTRWPLFRGYGPLPGIVEATCEGPLALGSRVRVRNTDGSVHTEVVAGFEPGRRYAVRMELAPPASRVMASIEEEVEFAPVEGGTLVRRRFTATPRAWFTTPLAWLFGGLLLRRAVLRHDAAVAAALGRGPPRAGPLRRGWLAYPVFALVLLAWATVIPMGEVTRSTSDWVIDGRFSGGGRRWGTTTTTQQGWGMPAGTIVFTESTWTAFEETPAGPAPLPVTDALKTEVDRRWAEEEGWGLSLGSVIPPPPLLVLIFFWLTCLWWSAVTAWRWRRGAWARNAGHCAVLSLWPALFLTISGLILHDRRGLAPIVQQVVSAQVAIVGTALVVTLGLVVHLGLRHRAEDGEAGP